MRQTVWFIVAIIAATLLAVPACSPSLATLSATSVPTDWAQQSLPSASLVASTASPTPNVTAPNTPTPVAPTPTPAAVPPTSTVTTTQSTISTSSATPVRLVTPSPTGTGPPATPTSPPRLTAAATPTNTAKPGNSPSQQGQPNVAGVTEVTPKDVLAFLRSGGADSILDFSPSDILETMDTVILDRVRQDRGDEALQRVYETIAGAVLATLRGEYPSGWILVALDAGHGGTTRDWDGGAEGTEARHNRGVVAALERLARLEENSRIIPRRIFNDEVIDDFGVPAQLNKTVENHILMRQARAAMLAGQAAQWNGTVRAMAVHEISIHFNAGAGGAMVLHQGSTVRPELAAKSISFARRYLQQVLPELNALAVLPGTLRLWGGDGLHDDVMMYRPAYLSDAEISGLTLRYGALQGKGFLARYAQTVSNIAKSLPGQVDHPASIP